MKAFNHLKSLLGGNGFDPIDPSRLLALIVLCHPSHGQHPCRPGLHQQLLQFLDCPVVTTRGGSKDALLYAVRLLLKLAPGQPAPTLTRRVKDPGCLRFCHTTRASFFQIIVLTSAYPGHYPRHWLLEQSCSQGRASGSLLAASTFRQEPS